jgi:hypothetical protein
MRHGRAVPPAASDQTGLDQTVWSTPFGSPDSTAAACGRAELPICTTRSATSPSRSSWVEMTTIRPASAIARRFYRTDSIWV